MSPRRKHPGGRPRSPHSILDFAEKWGISEKSARRLRSRSVPDDVLSILVAESKRYRDAQLHLVPARGRHTGGLKALGMKSRIPGFRDITGAA